MENIKTTTELLEASRNVLAEAEKVQTREDHARVWDKKVQLLRMVNEALESGYYLGEAYEELREARHTLYQAEIKAGEASLQTYAKEEA